MRALHDSAATGNRTRIPKLATSSSTLELSPRDVERAAGIEPASGGWKPHILPLDDARLNAAMTGATRGNRTRRLLGTNEVPRRLGLSGM